MAITTEIIGKFGGGGVESVEVSGREITTSNTIIHTVEVPPEKQVLVSFIGRFSKIPNLSSAWPVLKLGTTETTTGSTSRDVAISAVLTQNGNLTVSASGGTLSATLSSGTVYITELH